MPLSCFEFSFRCVNAFFQDLQSLVGFFFREGKWRIYVEAIAEVSGTLD